MILSKRELLIGVFSELNAKHIEYIVLRKHDYIPNRISFIDDLDLICKRSQRKEIKNIFSDLKYKFHEDSSITNTYLYGAFPHDHFRSLNYDLHIDVVYQLAYRSTNNREWIPAHENLQKGIWDRKIETDSFWKYKSSDLDELVHIISHCILDKRKVDEYYKKRIEILNKSVDTNELKGNLELLFFKYSSEIISQINNTSLQSLFDNYLTFKDY